MRFSDFSLPAFLANVSFSLADSPPTYGHDPSSACSNIAKSFHYPGVTVNFAQHVPANTTLAFSQAGNLSSCARPSQLVPVDLCRVAMRVETSSRSEITLEAWLPTNWTGRFLSTGNGGLSGCIQYEDMAYTAGYGFATVGANNGHNGTAGGAFYNNADVVADFAYRSVHTGVVVGKALTKAFYGQQHKKSYYLGCSTGGRQAFKSIQDFPADFDGVVAGAPAVAFNNLSSWSGHFLLITGSPNASTFLTPEKWALVHQDILAQCDTLDGVKDGILEDPELCPYRPENLQCSPNSGNSSSCLTASQVLTVRQVFTDYYGLNGSLIFPRMNYGSELADPYIYYSGQPFPYTVDWFRYAIYNDPSWQASQLSLQDAANAAAINPFNIETWKGDLSAFQKRGGKVLHYHGLADSIITSENSPRYYNHVSNTMALPSKDLDEFYRFFRISGMDHCSGGVGAWGIGQNSQVVNGTAQTPQNNVLLRMVDWIENGNAPETVTGYKYINVSSLF